MLWLIPAILAGLLWAISNIGDKYIVSQKIKNPFVYLILLGLFGLISIIFLPFTSFENFSLQIGLLLVLASALYFVASVPYLKALQLEEVSRVNIWWSLIPIFSFVIGFAGGLEKFSFNELFAFIFLVTGSFIASLHSDSKKVYFSKAVGYMIPAGIFFAIYGHILHFVTQTISFVTTFVVVELFIFIFALLWLLSWKKLRQDVGKDIAKYGYVIILIIFMIFIFEISGVFMNLWALSLGPASLVFSTEGFQSLFVFIIAVLLSIFYPKIIKEEIDRKNILLKISALILMMSGIVILYLL